MLRKRAQEHAQVQRLFRPLIEVQNPDGHEAAADVCTEFDAQAK